LGWVGLGWVGFGFGFGFWFGLGWVGLGLDLDLDLDLDLGLGWVGLAGIEEEVRLYRAVVSVAPSVLYKCHK